VASMRDIRRRIKSVSSTQKITKAMKMVSASKLRKAQSSLVAVRPYSDKIQEVMDHILSGGKQYENPLMIPRPEVKKILYIVMAGDRGLCGGYNVNLFRKAEQILKARPEGTECGLVLVGRRAADYFKRRSYPIDKVFVGVGDCPDVSQGKALSDFVIKQFLDGEVDEVHMIYQKFKSVLSQVPSNAQILPIPSSASANANASAGQAEHSQSEYIFEPDEAAILDVVLPQYVNSTVYRLLLEAKAGEHGARMTAMGSATDNAVELIDKLTLSLNRARQAAITTEITEIVGGAAALE
jgi:F-type H+-transporting ATPase subunit gamma